MALGDTLEVVRGPDNMVVYFEVIFYINLSRSIELFR